MRGTTCRNLARVVPLGLGIWLWGRGSDAQILDPLNVSWSVRCLAAVDCHAPAELRRSSDSLVARLYVHANLFGCSPALTRADGYASQDARVLVDSIWIYQLAFASEQGANSLAAMGSCDGSITFRIEHRCLSTIKLELGARASGSGVAAAAFTLTGPGSASSVVDSLGLQAGPVPESDLRTSHDRRVILEAGYYTLDAHIRGDGPGMQTGRLAIVESYLLAQIKFDDITQVAASTWTKVKSLYR